MKGDEQGEVGMRKRSHAVFWSCCKSQTMPIFFLMLMKLLTRTMKETDDDEWDGDRNELMTTMMRTKKMMRMTKMMKMMRMMRTPKMRMKMKMRMMIMMSRAVVGLQNLWVQQAKPSNAVIFSLAKCCKQKKRNIKKIRPPKQNPNLHKNVQDIATYV